MKGKEHLYNPVCRESNCKYKYLLECPVCKDELGKIHLAHPVLHIDTSNITKTHFGAVIVFQHIHFVPKSYAQARNTWCEEDYILIPRKYVKISYRINDDEPLDEWLF